MKLRFFWLGAALMLTSAALSHATDEIVDALARPWKGDFEEMLERRQIRALVVYSKLMYFLDGATQRGISYDALQGFEKHINETYDLGARKFHVVYIPVPRDELFERLNEGLGDIAVANLTVTPGRRTEIDFSDPVYSDVSEILVTGPSAPAVKQLDDLSGVDIHVRESSSYHESLVKVNQGFAGRGLAPIRIVPVDEHLEDSDLLEMVNAGLLPMVFVDSHKAAFWAEVFSDITLHPGIAIREGGAIAWAIRKDSPTLMAVVNQFVAENKKGTLIGNILLKRYLQENEWVHNAASESDREKFQTMLTLFRRYGEQYEFDHLMLGALGYQESQLDQSRRSSAGAIGIMQMKPSTAADPNVGIPDIEVLENNVHAGTKYLRFIRDRYFEDPAIDPLDRVLFTFAAYNAGPARIAKLRKQAAEMGLNPNVWFGNVEHAVAKEVGRETVHYVSNISKYYLAYRLLSESSAARGQALEQMKTE